MSISVNEVKALLMMDPADTSKDAYFEAVIPALEDYVKAECNHDFTDEETGEVKYPGGVRLAIAKMAEYNSRQAGIQSRRLARRAETYTAEYPRSITKLLDPYRRVYFI